MYRLCPDTIGVIASFMTNSEQRAFAHTNKQLHADMAMYRIINLNKKYSLRFMSEPQFQATVLNTTHKVGLCFATSYKDPYMFEDAIQIIYLYKIFILDGSGANIGANILSRVHTLNLSGCRNITDVSALGRVHTLNLSECRNITDVSALGRVHTLNLSGCCNITDVSALGRVHTLNLCGCRNITDVSALGRVHTLDLGCCNITDVSALGRVHTLNLSCCWEITDVSALGRVHTLNLCSTHITDVSALGRVHTLNLSCTQITDVSALGNVYTLDLCYCPGYLYANTLKNVRNLIMNKKQSLWY